MTPMINTIPPGDHKQTHIIGRSQGYLGLAVNFHTVVDATTEAEAPALTTAWQPTPEQIADIVAGAAIVVRLINVVQHPPIMVGVGDRPEGV